MRHRLKGRQLSRNATHRLALFRNLSRALITHERIITTLPKARELRPFVEKLITLARKANAVDDGTKEGRAKAVHYRRLAAAKLGPTQGTGVYDKKGDLVTDGNDTVMKKLFNVLGKRFAERPGGYTRIIKRLERRLGDAGETALIELLQANETKPAEDTAPAPAVAE